MKVVIKNIVIGLFCMLSITSYAASTTTPLAENYECQRIDSSKHSTSYQVTIKPTGRTYTFQWVVEGKPVLYGTGVVQSDVKNAISAIFWDPENTDVYGVEIFEIKPDGSLSADWIEKSQTQLGSETCTKK